MELTIAQYGLLILCLFSGTFTHVIKKIVEMRQTDETFTLKIWLTKYPYKTALTFMAGVGGFLGLMAAGELSYVSSFMVGYMANSLGGAAK
jgi:hypothetical protein